MKARTFVLLLSCSACATGVSAQDFDILIRGGHVLDARNDVDAVMDVAIDDGVIAEVAASIDPSRAETVVDAAGLYVTPGLVDLHAHVFFGTESNAYLSNGYSALPPDGFTFRAGVTTVVDLGDAGWRNFPQFKEQVIDRSRTRVLAFLNIVGSGMKGGPVEQNLADMDANLTAMRAAEYDELIVGVKVAHYAGDDWHPVDRAVAAGEAAGIPVAVDFGGHVPPLSLEDLFMTHLRPGDIFTHTYANVRGRVPIVDDEGQLRPFVRRARARGIVFDVGHGGGSFLFSQAIPAMEQGFPPDTISTDLHTGSMNAGMKDMLNVMSKFLVMGMSLEDVISAATWRAAQAIHRDDLGHLSVGAEADIAVLRLRKGDFGFVDVGVRKLEGSQKLECELTLRAGDVVWDLNGLSR
jgi:dihydroorotase